MPMLLAWALLCGADDPLASRAGPQLRKRIDLDRALGPVGPALRELVAAQRLPVVFDERVDLAAPVRIFYRQTRVGDILGAAARHASGRFAMIGEVGYFGPGDGADRAAAAGAAARASLAGFPKPLRAALLARKAWQWDDQKTVATLVSAACAEANVPLKGDLNDLDVAPLAGALADAPALDALLAWCALADCTLEFSAAQAAIVKLPKEANLERALKCRSPMEAGKRAAEANALPAPGKDEPSAAAEALGSTVKFRGPWSALWAASAAEDPPKLVRRAGAAGAPARVYRMDFKNGSLQSFGEQLAKATGKKVTFDEAGLKASGKSLEDTVTCTARNATLEDLLELALNPLGLVAKVGPDAIGIAVAPK